MTRPRTAFTLLEVLISMAILGGVLAAILGSLTAVTDYTRLGDSQDDLAMEGKMLLRQVADDVSLAGWYVPSDQGYQSTQSLDRNARYYPYIQQQAPAGESPGSGLGMGLGAQFPHHRRAANQVVLGSLPEEVPGAATDFTTDFDETHVEDTGSILGMDSYYKSFRARSQEIIFLRSRQGTAIGEDGIVVFPKDNTDAWNMAPTTNAASGLKPQDALGILAMDEWRRASDEPDLVTEKVYFDATSGRWYRLRNGRKIFDLQLYSAWLDLASGQPQMYWESMEDLDTSATANPASLSAKPVTYVNTDSGRPYTHILREYSFCVIPSKTGYGRLVRCIKKSFATMPTVVTTAGADVGAVLAAAIDPDPKNTTGYNVIYGTVIDKVLSDNVVRVVFDTVRTVRLPQSTDAVTYGGPTAEFISREALDLNQVRVRLYLAKKIGTGASARVVFRRIETLVSMRARSGVGEVAEDRTAQSGSAVMPDFFPR